MSVLLAGELAGRSEAGDAVPHLQDLEALLAAFLPARVAEASGVDAETIRAIAATLTSVRPAVVCAALGAGDDLAGAWAAVVRLQALLDDIAGARHVSLPRGGGNAQGVADMGVAPDLLPGHVPVSDEGGRRRFAEAWGVADLPARAGAGTAAMLAGLAAGEIRALWVCADDARVFGADTALLEALAGAELVVAQGAVRGDLAEAAHVVLPSVSWGEEDGTFVNAERRVSRVRRVRRPPAEVRPGWWIFREVARRLGHDWPAPYPEAIWNGEIAVLAPGLAGVTYDELERWGLCWHTPAHDEAAVAAASGAG
jgi:predicted molibdopterin-dependent oxidoreductase YjgC